MRLPRFAPLTGIVFVVLLVLGIGVVGGNTPESDDSGPSIANYYHDHPAKQIWAIALVALAALFLALFVVALSDYLRGTSTDRGFWPTVALVGGTVAVAGTFMAIAIHAALVDGGHSKISPDAMQALNSLDNLSFFAFATPFTILMFGVAGSVLKAAAPLPRWLGWVALVLAILFFAGPVGFFAFLLTGIWIIVASIFMYQRSGAAPA
jgi:uncharacterized membrane protein